MDIRHTSTLFPVLSQKLSALLKSLSPEQWQSQTVARQWKVKDVASHLLDTALRRVALMRDGWQAPPEVEIRSYEDLVDFLNTLNKDWVRATRRLSPPQLIEWLERTDQDVHELMSRLDPEAAAPFSVAWAGHETSPNWFDIAREYTERFLHQQQIRHAIGDNELLTDELYKPFLDIFMHAWPVACRDLEAAEGDTLQAVVTGPGGGEWFLQFRSGVWALSNTGANPVATTTIDGSVAWILFSKSRRAEDLKEHWRITGDQTYGRKLLEMVSVMA